MWFEEGIWLEDRSFPVPFDFILLFAFVVAIPFYMRKRLIYDYPYLCPPLSLTEMYWNMSVRYEITSKPSFPHWKWTVWLWGIITSFRLCRIHLMEFIHSDLHYSSLFNANFTIPNSDRVGWHTRASLSILGPTVPFPSLWHYQFGISETCPEIFENLDVWGKI